MSKRFVRRGRFILVLAFLIGGCQPAPPMGKTAVATRGDLTRKIVLPGTLSAVDQREIVLPVNAELKTVDVRAGDAVEKGGRLAEFAELPDDLLANDALRRQFQAVQMALEESLGTVPVLTFFGGKVADVTSRVGDLVKENAPLLTVTSAPGGDEKTITSPAAGTLIRLYVEPGQLLPPNDKNVVGLIQIRKPDLTARGLREILTDPHVSPAQRKLAGDALELMAKLRRDGPDVEERGKGRLALVSPVSGKVLYVNEAFSYRTQFPADTLAFLIGRDDSMIVQFGVPEFSLDKVRPGQTVAVTVGENDTRAFPGRLEMIQSAPDARRQGPVARYTALASVENPGSVLKHGANCRVSITLESRKNVLLLPVEFVHEGNGWYVDVVDGEGVRRQDVTVGLVAEGKVEIASGLREGQRVSIGTP